MFNFKNVTDGYENTRLVHYRDAGALPNAVRYSELNKSGVSGVLKANMLVDGELYQNYSGADNHVCVIAATRLGKTTSYVIPTILSFAEQRVKKSMIISDPKGELYRLTSEKMRENGYKVKLLNFRDCTHSECWNMLTPIFRKYKKAEGVYSEVGVTDTAEGARNVFRGRIYSDQRLLDADVGKIRSVMLDEVGNDIDTLTNSFISTSKLTDPYWEDSARELMKAFLWAMLEDSDPDADEDKKITEDTYSFSTMLQIMSSFSDDTGNNYNDRGYFSGRPSSSRALALAKNCILENAPVTRKCVVSTFNSKIAMFRESAMRLITSCNTFELEELVDGPFVLYVNYRDELKVHYQIISTFIQNAYAYLIDKATAAKDGKLDVPFYFILDEFGNFPAIKDFETTISACAGRNIFFILIIQSYAQLNNVYGESVAEIIRDNLNMHVFFGSNNVRTLEEFSDECGMYTRVSPVSALNGGDEEISSFQLETIRLIPKSTLSHFEAGECVITEANSGYTMYSRLERYFVCPQFANLKTASERDYACPVDPYDDKYFYKVKEAVE